MARPSSFWLIGLIFLRLVFAVCFLPNSTDRNALGLDRYRPSGVGSALDGFSMCCRLVGVDSPDVPRPDGLCTSGTRVWRESCTDPTWASPSCIKLCVNGTDENGLPMKDNDEIITPCADQSYCCGSNNNECCDQGQGVWVKDGLPTRTNPNSTESTQTEVAISGVPNQNTTPVSPGPTPSPTESHGLTGGAIAGIVIGCLLGLMTLGLAFWCFARRKRRRTVEGRHNDTTGAQPVTGWEDGKEQKRTEYKVAELRGTAPAIHEMDAGAPPMPELHAKERSELAGSTPPRKMDYETQLGNLQATGVYLVRVENQAPARPGSGMVMQEQRQANGRASMEMDTRSPQTPIRIVKLREPKNRLEISACVIAALTEVAMTDTDEELTKLTQYETV
ncbi:MAG: hypothetical protein Q9198_005732, partial [Flavoplaca austrocitrina]